MSLYSLDCLDPDEGLFVCLKRLAARQRAAKDRPDLFDTAELQLERASSGSTRFVVNIACCSGASASASPAQPAACRQLRRLLVRNASHLPVPAALYQLAERSFNAFAQHQATAVVYLKSLYLL